MPHCTSARHVQSYPRVSIVYYWKCRRSSSNKLKVFKWLKKKICRFSTLIWPFGIKRNFLNIISYLQDVSNHILDYHLSKCRQSSSGNNFTRNVIICHLIDPWPKNVIFKILLLICKDIIWYELRCRRSSNDKLTDGGIDNILKLF